MSYKIELHARCVIVRLVGHVKVTDLLLSHEDTLFMTGLEETSVAVYDYSAAQQVDITKNDTVHLARLAEHVVRFQSPFTIIIVPRSPTETQLADLYCQTIASDELDARVALSVDDALASL